MIRFRLSDNVKNMLSMSAGKNGMSKTQRAYYDSPEFYKNHPDLAPRNIYLATGRVIKMKEVDDYLNKMSKLSFKERCELFFDKLSRIFKSNNRLSANTDIK